MFDADNYKIATTAAGIADRSSRGTVVAVGIDVVPLLQGVVTSDVFALAEEGSGQLSVATNSTGRMVCEVRLLHVPELLIMDFEPGAVAGGALSHFRANVMMEDAKFIDRSGSSARLCVVGPNAHSVIAAAARLVRPLEPLSSYHASWGAVGNHDVIVQRLPNYGVSAFDIILAADAVEEVRAALDLPELSAVTLETLRIEAGVPRWGAELDPKIIPLEAGLGEAISYEKGCYVGQEIIARLDTLGRPAKLLRTLLFDRAREDVEVGTEVTSGGKVAGEVRSVTWSPRCEATVALAYVKRDHYEIGNTVEVAGHTATVDELGLKSFRTNSRGA